MLEQFAQIYEDKVRVVGMGTQDSFGLAEDFLARNELSTPLMTWDETFETWAHYDVRGQPVVILLDPAGQMLGQWYGLTREAADLVENF